MNFATGFIETVYKGVLKPFFFLFDPEFVHDRMTNFGTLLGKSSLTRRLTAILFRHSNEEFLAQKIHNIHFPNPVGLSAGFDKNANLLNILSEVGFGFMEVGSITDKPYEGNPKPRLYRLKKSKALLVYYGLNNIGAEAIIKRIARAKTNNFPQNISIAKTNCEETNSLESGTNDYIDCLKKVQKSNVGDLYTINISCPNTFGGEPFTTPDKLEFLLKRVAQLKLRKPIFIKMPINLTWKEFDGLLKVALKYHVSGVIIGNLNKDHASPAILDQLPAGIKGGISGKPTFKLSNELITKTYKKYGKRLTIIGVGGIFSAQDAYEKIKRGASLVALITGMIYEGPQLIGKINRELVELLKKDGYSNINQAIGAYYK